MVGGGRPLLLEILGQLAPVGGWFKCYALSCLQLWKLLLVEMLAHDDGGSSPGMELTHHIAMLARSALRVSRRWPVNSERIVRYHMSDTEVEELYSRHEARLGAAMIKSLGSSLLRMDASVASVLLPLPLERQTALVADLKEDPVR